MSLITLSHVTHVSEKTVKDYLASINSYERRVYANGDVVKEYPSTLDAPFALTGIYEIPVNWPIFWTALDNVSSNDVVEENGHSLNNKIMSVSEFIRNAIGEYKMSSYYQNAKKVILDKQEAEKQEAESLRRNVPEITARYDVLEKELREVEATLFAYQKHLRNIKASVTRIDKMVDERNMPKWLKSDMSDLRTEVLYHYDVSGKRWERPPKALRLSDFTEAERADGTAERQILEQTTLLVNKGF